MSDSRCTSGRSIDIISPDLFRPGIEEPAETIYLPFNYAPRYTIKSLLDHVYACISGRGIRPVLKPLLSPVLAALTVFWIAIGTVPPAAAAPGGQKVLVMHSYHQGYLWTDMIQDGFSRSLSTSFPKAEVYVEYMNTKRQTADTMFPRLRDLYKLTYANVTFDVIVASDNNALDFLQRYRDSLFPGVPVVFCGINNIATYNFDPADGYTGISEDLDIVSTITAALLLHPETKKVALITDATETGLINLELVRKVAGRFPAVKFIELHKLTAAQLSTRLKGLSDDTIVLGLSFFRDPEGRTFTARESMEFIVNASRRPVYTAWDFYMVPGAMGGKLLSGRLQGENAADLAGRILRGERAGTIPIVESPTAFIFDYAGLQKFSISESLLPAGSLVTGRPDSFYTRYKYYLWIGGGLFIAQVLIISLLSWNIAHRRREETARQKAEETLRKSKQQYDKLVSKISAGIYILRSGAKNEFALDFVSPRMAEILNVSVASLLADSTAFFPNIHPDDVDSFVSQNLEGIKLQRPFDWEGRYLVAGKVKWLHFESTPEALENGEVLWHGVISDITDRKEHENEQLKIEKLESLGVLAGGIAHDFNNILTGIMGNISFAQMFLDPTHRSYKPLLAAEKASVRAAELAHQLLTFARGGEPVKKVLSVQHLVGESVSLVLHGSNVKGSIEIPDSIDAIEADEGQMSQLFHNIIINATQAMPGGGVLTVSAHNEILSAANTLALAGGRYVRLTLTDQGCGIAEEDLIRIFDPYFTTKSSGTGLGLASAHSIVIRHGGHIGVSSIVGTGTTFTIHLPSIGKTYSSHLIDAVAQATGDHRGGSILVMDDEEMIRDMTTCMLEQLGYQVTTCENGAEAITRYLTARESGMPFSAVIMDLTIPGGMGGKETAQQLLCINPQACLIVSSGYSNDPIMSDYTSYGFSGAVAKPYKMMELERLLSSLLTAQQTATSPT